MISRVVLLSSLVLFRFLHAAPAGAEAGLRYENRGNRYEGIRPVDVNAWEIELISVLAAYRERPDGLPASFKVRFFLDSPEHAYLIVRELDPEHHYWLDRITPAKPWRPGFGNVFEWPTGEVIRHLDGLGLYDLGVIARLGYREADAVERVAPVILYHDEAPEAVAAYLFTLVTRRDVWLESSVYPEGSSEPIWSEYLPMQRGGRPFVIRWDSSKAAEGHYRLVVDGQQLADAEDVRQIVRFFHRPAVD